MTRHTTAQGTRYVTHWRDHTSQARRTHIHGAIEPMDEDIRKGSIRGFMAMCLVFAGFWLAWGMLP